MKTSRYVKRFYKPQRIKDTSERIEIVVVGSLVIMILLVTIILYF